MHWTGSVFTWTLSFAKKNLQTIEVVESLGFSTDQTREPEDRIESHLERIELVVLTRAELISADLVFNDCFSQTETRHRRVIVHRRTWRQRWRHVGCCQHAQRRNDRSIITTEHISTLPTWNAAVHLYRVAQNEIPQQTLRNISATSCPILKILEAA